MRESGFLTENSNVLALLKRIEKFKAFSDDDLRSFIQYGKLMEYAAGETIIKKGEVDNWAFFLISGQVKIVKGDKTFAVFQRSGDLFGEMGVIDGSPRSASVWALSKSMVLGIDCTALAKDQLPQGTALHYTVFRLFAEVLAERLRITNEEVSALQKALQEKEAIIAQFASGEKTIYV